MRTLAFYETLIINWAQQRELFKHANPSSQMLKTMSEVGELADAIAKNQPEELKDAIGDIAVTLIIQARMHNLSFEECLEAAWRQIKDRQGKTVNGVFIKDE